MTKLQKLASVGLTDSPEDVAKFYDMFPTQEAYDSYMAGNKMAMGGITNGIAFPQQPDASSRRVPYYDKGGFFAPNVMPWNGPVGFYQNGGSSLPINSAMDIMNSRPDYFWRAMAYDYRPLEAEKNYLQEIVMEDPMLDPEFLKVMMEMARLKKFNYRELPMEKFTMEEMNVADPMLTEQGFNYKQLPMKKNYMQEMNVEDVPIEEYDKMKDGGATNQIAFPQQPTAHINFSAFPWQPSYNMGGDLPAYAGGGPGGGGQPLNTPAPAPNFTSKLFVDNLNDPRLRMFNDSMAVYKHNYIDNQLRDKASTIGKEKSLALRNAETKKSNQAYARLHAANKVAPKEIGVTTDATGEKFYKYQAPKREVVYKPKVNPNATKTALNTNKVKTTVTNPVAPKTNIQQPQNIIQQPQVPSTTPKEPRFDPTGWTKYDSMSAHNIGALNGQKKGLEYYREYTGVPGQFNNYMRLSKDPNAQNLQPSDKEIVEHYLQAKSNFPSYEAQEEYLRNQRNPNKFANKRMGGGLPGGPNEGMPCMECGGYMEDGGYADQFGGMVDDQVDYFKEGGNWIQKATASIKRRGTEGVCTGSNFGGPKCPPGSKRYNLAKTFRKMAKGKKAYGGVTGEGMEDTDSYVNGYNNAFLERVVPQQEEPMTQEGMPMAYNGYSMPQMANMNMFGYNPAPGYMMNQPSIDSPQDWSRQARINNRDMMAQNRRLSAENAGILGAAWEQFKPFWDPNRKYVEHKFSEFKPSTAKHGGSPLPHFDPGGSLEDFYKKQAEAEALDIYNKYKNQGASTMTQYNADPNDAIYNQILENTKRRYTYNTPDNNSNNTNTNQPPKWDPNDPGKYLDWYYNNKRSANNQTKYDYGDWGSWNNVQNSGTGDYTYNTPGGSGAGMAMPAQKYMQDIMSGQGAWKDYLLAPGSYEDLFSKGLFGRQRRKPTGRKLTFNVYRRVPGDPTATITNKGDGFDFMEEMNKMKKEGKIDLTNEKEGLKQQSGVPWAETEPNINQDQPGGPSPERVRQIQDFVRSQFNASQAGNVTPQGGTNVTPQGGSNITPNRPPFTYNNTNIDDFMRQQVSPFTGGIPGGGTNQQQDDGSFPTQRTNTGAPYEQQRYGGYTRPLYKARGGYGVDNSPNSVNNMLYAMNAMNPEDPMNKAGEITYSEQEKRDLTGRDYAGGIMGGVGLFNYLANQNQMQRNQLRMPTTADEIADPMQAGLVGYRGNIGAGIAPQAYGTPFGGTGTTYGIQRGYVQEGGEIYEEGDVVDLTEDEIRALKAKGYDIEEYTEDEDDYA